MTYASILAISILSTYNSGFAATVTPIPAIEFNRDTCKDFDQITDEVIKLELAGTRWRGGLSSCLKQSEFKTVLAVQKKVSDSKLLDPELVLPKDRSIRIVSKKWLDIGGFEVRFAYIGKKNGKDVPIEDRLIFSLHYGSLRAKKGCASITEDPIHFVMREGCVKD